MKIGERNPKWKIETIFFKYMNWWDKHIDKKTINKVYRIIHLQFLKNVI